MNQKQVEEQQRAIAMQGVREPTPEEQALNEIARLASMGVLSAHESTQAAYRLGKKGLDALIGAKL